MLVADRGNGFLVTQMPHGDFELRSEFWADTGTNSGIFIRVTDPATITAANAYEVNIWDERPEQKYGTGAIVDVAAVNPMPKAGDKWNVIEIIAKGDSFTIVLNGQKTVDGARDAKHRTGRIALQHDAPGPVLGVPCPVHRLLPVQDDGEAVALGDNLDDVPLVTRLRHGVDGGDIDDGAGAVFLLRPFVPDIHLIGIGRGDRGRVRDPDEDAAIRAGIGPEFAAQLEIAMRHLGDQEAVATISDEH